MWLMMQTKAARVDCTFPLQGRKDASKQDARMQAAVWLWVVPNRLTDYWEMSIVETVRAGECFLIIRPDYELMFRSHFGVKEGPLERNRWPDPDRLVQG